ncbi:hypothetical protein MMC26_002606 [Xylographa opegraphella]|nr:hypothetical protein [Xylographa opegraphella]
MRATSFRSFSTSTAVRSVTKNQIGSKPPVIRIANATFYKQHPASANASNPPLFSGLTFSLPSFPKRPERWSIISPSSTGKTTFLEVLQGQHICIPPNGRSFPYLSTDDVAAKDPHLRVPTRAIQYVGFNGTSSTAASTGTRGAYLSARYESRREETDFSLLEHLKGKTSLNLSEEVVENGGAVKKEKTLREVIRQLKLEALLDLPVGNLSNGQTRRARIAKALMSAPEALLLDEPFMGLDPPTTSTISSLLYNLAASNSPRIVLGLRPQDILPDWITHLVYLDLDHNVTQLGPKDVVLSSLRSLSHPASLPNNPRPARSKVMSSTITKPAANSVVSPSSQNAIQSKADRSEKSPAKASLEKSREALIEMSGVEVKYGDMQVLGAWEQMVDGQPKKGLWWTVKRGSRWGIFGPNGSGKTTILSLICSDHPQTYSLPIKLFGRSRLPTPGQPGISIFDIQSRIGHSSPEIHAFFPRELTIRQTLENAWADTFRGKATLSHDNDVVVDACLRWFERELNPAFSGPDPAEPVPHVRAARHGGRLGKQVAEYLERDIDWADGVRFGDVSVAAQRVALLLRALIKKPDVVILDEAFSVMDTATRDKCMTFLAHGESAYLPETKTRNAPPETLVTTLASEGTVAISGLEARQALVCVSHLAEEVPDLVTEWMCLPEPNEGKAVRFGTRKDSGLNDGTWWDAVWKM